MIGIIKRARKTDCWTEVNKFKGYHKACSETYTEKNKAGCNGYCF